MEGSHICSVAAEISVRSWRTGKTLVKLQLGRLVEGSAQTVVMVFRLVGETSGERSAGQTPSVRLMLSRTCHLLAELLLV